MTDVALNWLEEAFAADLGLVNADLAVDQGLRTALIVSLFTDRRAQADDVLPEPGADPRGWWGDVAAERPGDRIGSRLWLLAREKQRPQVLARAREYAREATAWLVEDRVASAVEVEAEFVASGVLGLKVAVVRPDGPAREQFDFIWSAV